LANFDKTKKSFKDKVCMIFQKIRN